MLEVDLHSHTLFSKCGIHTHIEMLERARKIGLKGLAITDHGPALGSHIPMPFFDRLHNPVEGIKLIKGIECNLLNENGRIDLPAYLLTHLDIVLLGIHPNIKKGLNPRKYTDMLISAINKNPCIDIITHPDESEYPVDFFRLAKTARENGVALELNNSKTMLKRTTPEITKNLIKACKNTGCKMVICSDAHSIEEIGLDNSVKHFLKQENFPEELLINSSVEKAFAFINERKTTK